MFFDVGTGLIATKARVTDADMIFLWHATESNNDLTVTVRYGAGISPGAVATAEIPWGILPFSPPVPIEGSSDPAVGVNGILMAAWGERDETNRPSSYVISFTGYMLRAGVNDVASSSVTDHPQDGLPIIVCARLRQSALVGSE